MRADLQEQGAPLGQQTAGDLLEADGVAEVVVPVGGVECGGVRAGGGDGGVERHGGGDRRDRRQVLQQTLADLLHLRAVRGVVHRDTPRPDPLHLAVRQQLLHRIRLTRDDRGTGPVDHRDRQPLPARRQLLRLLQRQRQRHHPPTPRQLLSHRTRPQRHDPRPVLQRQTTRHHRRRDLPLGMPHHRRRHHTHRRPQLRQRHHHRPQNRLNHLHPIQLGTLTTHHIQQRELRERRKRPPTLPHRPGEHRLPLQQLRSHTHPLRTLTRKDEDRAALPRVLGAGDHLRGLPALGERGQATAEPCVVLGQHHRAVLQHRPGGGAGEADVHGRRGVLLPGLLEVAEQPPGLSPQRLLGAPGQDPGQDGESGPLRSALRDGHGYGYGHGYGRTARLRRAVLLQHHMRVGTTHTERRDGRTARLLPAGPLPRLPQQLDRAGGPVHMRRRLIHMQSPRHHPVPQRLHHLDHTTGTRRSLRMPDVRLDRPQPQRPLRRTILTIGVEQRLRLDRITQRRTRTVRLHHIDIRRR